MNRYSTTDTTKWAVVLPGPLTVSGTNEIVAAFTLKRDAEKWARENFGRRWRISVSVVAKEALK